MELIVYTNSTFTEEQALSVDGAVVLQGDYYHDKITDQIDGFIACLDYFKISFTLSDTYLHPTDDLFAQIEFYNATEEEC
jgi:hypothetical protein